MPTPPRPFLVLAILDGWGFSPQREGNAIAACPSDHVRRLMDRYPTALLDASGEAVGLPDGVMGNSEVGHLTIGAGHVVNQDVTAINKAIREGELPRNKVLTAALDKATQQGTTVHFLGLASDASVHSNLAHLRELVKLAASRGAGRVRVHAFTDGRDTAPTSGRGYLEELEAFLREAHTDAAIATVGGRYYAMDRDKRWDRVEKAWRALVLGEGHRAPSGTAAVEQAYQRGETDEFILPTVVDGPSHTAIADGDVVIFFNFRPDRAREMTRALTEDEFDEFPRPEKPGLAGYVCFTRYDASFDLPVAFRPRKPEMVLGRLFSDLGHTQLRIAETEKYAHVTYFLNGGVERTFPGEDRILIPSPRVATYDLKPEMSAPEVTERMLERMRAAETDVIVINYANADMVGHTGDFAATLAACEVVDRAIGRIHAAAREAGSLLAVTGDHGNAEQMLDPQTGGIMTAHTTNPVPFILAREDLIGLRLSDGGGLSNLLPTILTVLGIEAPVEMDGRSLA